MSTEAVKTAINGSVLEVVLDRPKANAIDAPTSRRMGEIFAGFRDDPELRVAIITGGGEKFFCAGSIAASFVDFAGDLMNSFHRVVECIQ